MLPQPVAGSTNTYAAPAPLLARGAPTTAVFPLMATPCPNRACGASISDGVKVATCVKLVGSELSIPNAKSRNRKLSPTMAEKRTIRNISELRSGFSFDSDESRGEGGSNIYQISPQKCKIGITSAIWAPRIAEESARGPARFRFIEITLQFRANLARN